LLYTTMCLQLVDQTPCYPKGILEDVNIWVWHHLYQSTLWLWKQVEMIEHPSFWDDHSWAQLKPSSTRIAARSVSQSMIARRGSILRNVHSRLLLIIRHCTSTRSQLLPQRRTTTRGRTKLSNQEKSQSGWSALLSQRLTTIFHHRISPSWMIQEYLPLIAWSGKVPSTRRSVILDPAST
jgi:hypothetical protein